MSDDVTFGEEVPLTDEAFAELCALAPDRLPQGLDGKAEVPEHPVHSVIERLWLEGLALPIAVYAGGRYTIFFQRSTRGEKMFRELKEAGR